MIQDKDWTETMRSALRDAEATPPADGWARLERELKAPAPRISAFRRYWPRIAAAAAAVLIFVGGGEFLLHEDRNKGNEGFVIATASDGGSTAADNSARSEEIEVAPENPVRGLIPSREAVEAERLPGAAAAAPGGATLRRQSEAYAENGRTATRAADSRSQEDAARRTTLLSAVTPAGRNAQTYAEETAGEESHGISGQSALATAVSAAGETPGAESVRRPAAQAESAAKHANEGARSEKSLSDSRAQSGDAESAGGHAAQKRGGMQPSSSDTRAGDDFVAYVAPRKKASFSLFAGGGVTGAGTTPGPGSMMMSNIAVGDGLGPMAQLRYNYEDNSFRHHQPFSFGLTVRKEFRHGLSLESGVNYTLLWSDVRVKSSHEDISQKLHFIGIPLRLNWQFYQTGGFSLYLGAGGMVEKCVAAKFGMRTVEESGVQWSATGAAGAQYMFGRLVGLYFEPEVAYYFTETRLRTARTDSPLSLALRLGVRFSF